MCIYIYVCTCVCERRRIFFFFFFCDESECFASGAYDSSLFSYNRPALCAIYSFRKTEETKWKKNGIFRLLREKGQNESDFISRIVRLVYKRCDH